MRKTSARISQIVKKKNNNKPNGNSTQKPLTSWPLYIMHKIQYHQESISPSLKTTDIITAAQTRSTKKKTTTTSLKMSQVAKKIRGTIMTVKMM